MDANSRTRPVSSGLTDEQRRIMLLDDIKHELKRGNEQHAELLALLRATVDADEVPA